MLSRSDPVEPIPDDDPGWNGDVWTGGNDAGGLVFVARNALKAVYVDERDESAE